MRLLSGFERGGGEGCKSMFAKVFAEAHQLVERFHGIARRQIDDHPRRGIKGAPWATSSAAAPVCSGLMHGARSFDGC